MCVFVCACVYSIVYSIVEVRGRSRYLVESFVSEYSVLPVFAASIFSGGGMVEYRSDRIFAMQLEGSRFESDRNHYVMTLEKLFCPNCL